MHPDCLSEVALYDTFERQVTTRPGGNSVQVRRPQSRAEEAETSRHDIMLLIPKEP